MEKKTCCQDDFLVCVSFGSRAAPHRAAPCMAVPCMAVPHRAAPCMAPPRMAAPRVAAPNRAALLFGSESLLEHSCCTPNKEHGLGKGRVTPMVWQLYIHYNPLVCATVMVHTTLSFFCGLCSCNDRFHCKLILNSKEKLKHETA